MHNTISLAILYWGTPVVLITTENEDGSYNISPISSCWWLAHRAMLGISSMSHTVMNLRRTKRCVLNLPSQDMAANINLLARTTGSNPVPEWKANNGYVYVKDKFAHAKLTPQASELVGAPRILECPVQMEAEMMDVHEMMGDLPDMKGALLAVEVKILRTHVEDNLRLKGHENRIDADKMSLLLMVFQEFYGLSAPRLGESRLAKIGEENYRGLTLGDEAALGETRNGVDDEAALGETMNGVDDEVNALPNGVSIQVSS